MLKLKRDSLYRLVKQNRGRFFTVAFKKKDGTERIMNCRTGVTKHLKGGECGIPANMRNGKPYAVVYDVAAEGYRVFNVETTFALTIGGKTYVVVD